MRVLLDTNIIIHRESPTVVEPQIGKLFKWLEDLRHEKCIHPLTVSEIEKHGDPKTVQAFKVKMDSYSLMKTVAPIHPQITAICDPIDSSENDKIDSKLLNELINGRVDIFISEDGKIHKKAAALGNADRVYSINDFLEKVIAENPGFVNYRVLAVKPELFGNIILRSPFFDSFRRDYKEFDDWFNKKSDKEAYVCREGNEILAFLFLKKEGEGENYSDITPRFEQKTRLKIGTLKVAHNGFRLGERFLKIAFDNAITLGVDELYLTIFNNSSENQRLIELIERFGFKYWGEKKSSNGIESVYVRDFTRRFDRTQPRATYPYVSKSPSVFLVPIKPDYHTDLLPDSILRTEAPANYEENKAHRNAIEKVYICRSLEKDIHPGDTMVFYRTGGYHKSVVTTLAIVETAITDIRNQEDFVNLCGNRSVFTAEKLKEWWNYNPSMRPFIVKFLYVYSFPKRINLKRLIEIGVIADINSAPRGFEKISIDKFKRIIEETETNERIIVD